MYLAELITADGVIDGAKAAKSNRIESEGRTFAYRISDTVSVTQNDVRSIQLAMASWIDRTSFCVTLTVSEIR